MSKTIKIIQIPVNDLTIRFARQMENGKIRHYILPLSNFTEDNINYLAIPPIALVSDYIRQEENDPFLVVEEIIPKKSNSKDVLNIVDISDKLLENCPEIKESLYNRKSNSTTLVVTTEKNFLFKILNKTLSKLNNSILKVFPARDFANNPFQFVRSNFGLSKKVFSARYLSYMYTVSEEAAFEKFRNDLKILQELDLIYGHFKMPSILELSDTTGFSPTRKSIFSFIFVDENKLCDLLSTKTLPGLPLKLLGIESETYEGNIGPFVGEESRVEIEEVIISSAKSPAELLSLVQENYKETIEEVNRVAQKSKAEMNKWRKVESSFENHQTKDFDGFSKTEVKIKTVLEKK